MNYKSCSSAVIVAVPKVRSEKSVNPVVPLDVGSTKTSSTRSVVCTACCPVVVKAVVVAPKVAELVQG